MGATATDEVVRLHGERSPCTVESWTWFRGEIDPKSEAAEQTAERLRKPEGGT
jgi:hypothetical protein